MAESFNKLDTVASFEEATPSPTAASDSVSAILRITGLKQVGTDTFELENVQRLKIDEGKLYEYIKELAGFHSEELNNAVAELIWKHSRIRILAERMVM